MPVPPSNPRDTRTAITFLIAELPPPDKQLRKAAQARDFSGAHILLGVPRLAVALRRPAPSGRQDRR